ncbi:TM2 domain-containing protein almondex, partial [Pseudolycoriella hygida]
MIIRRPVHINVTSAILLIVLNGVHYSNMAINHMEVSSKTENQKNATNVDFITNKQKSQQLSDISLCSIGVNCNELPAACITCQFNYSCIYGQMQSVTCDARPNVQCHGEREFKRSLLCRYCWQTESWEHSCVLKDNCNSINAYYFTNCSVWSDLLCLGNRKFQKRLRCNWTQGYKWSTALIISITLGGFGADRFYLGHWQEGIGKLFSFGGLGVWTLIDVTLISLHYLGPADGSLFI